jgi:hypothetical protein
MIRFCKLTRPDGQQLYLGENGMTIERALLEESAGQTRIAIGGVPRFVTETAEEVLQRLGATIAT